jgi:hypothetical protein
MKRFAPIAAVLVIASIVAASALAGSGHKTYAPKDCTRPLVRPSRIVFACADFGAYIDKLHWGHWGGHKARGSGSFREKDCTPSCASGHFKTYHADIRLRKVRVSKCGGRRVRLYHQALVNFPGKKPPDAEHFQKTRIFCNK